MENTSLFMEYKKKFLILTQFEYCTDEATIVEYNRVRCLSTCMKKDHFKNFTGEVCCRG